MYYDTFCLYKRCVHLENEYILSENAMHMRGKFQIDSETMFTLLEQELQRSLRWDHISKCKKSKDGRDTWKTL